MSLLLFLEVVYLRSSVLAGRCLPAVLTSTCGALGMFTSGGAEIVMPDGIGCIPPVVSPTLGGSKFVYTSGGSCGRACIIPPKVDRHLPAVLEVAYLRSSVLAGRCLPAVRSSTCGALGCLPPVGQSSLCLTAWGVYLRWFRLHSAGVSLCIPPVAPADVPALFHPR